MEGQPDNFGGGRQDSVHVAKMVVQTRKLFASKDLIKKGRKVELKRTILMDISNIKRKKDTQKYWGGADKNTF